MVSIFVLPAMTNDNPPRGHAVLEAVHRHRNRRNRRASQSLIINQILVRAGRRERDQSARSMIDSRRIVDGDVICTPIIDHFESPAQGEPKLPSVAWRPERGDRNLVLFPDYTPSKPRFILNDL